MLCWLRGGRKICILVWLFVLGCVLADHALDYSLTNTRLCFKLVVAMQLICLVHVDPHTSHAVMFMCWTWNSHLSMTFCVRFVLADHVLDYNLTNTWLFCKLTVTMQFVCLMRIDLYKNHITALMCWTRNSRFVLLFMSGSVLALHVWDYNSTNTWLFCKRIVTIQFVCLMRIDLYKNHIMALMCWTRNSRFELLFTSGSVLALHVLDYSSTNAWLFCKLVGLLLLFNLIYRSLHMIIKLWHLFSGDKVGVSVLVILCCSCSSWVVKVSCCRNKKVFLQMSRCIHKRI